MSPSPLLDPALRPVIAHRGASADAPENTLAAFTAAVEQGADAFELDVRLTRDGVPVVIHDATLTRTTDRHGVVADLSLAEIQQADAGAGFTPDRGVTYPWRAGGVRIPSLAEVLHAFPSIPVLIELKTGDAQEAVFDVLIQCGAAHRCAVAAADHRALRRFRGSDIALGASRRDIGAFYLRAHLGLPPSDVSYRLFAVPETYKGLPVPTGTFVHAARRVECPVHVWTVNGTDAARRLWERGVAGMITDRPGMMRRERGK